MLVERNRSVRLLLSLLLLPALSGCKNATVTQELLDADYLTAGQTAIDLLAPGNGATASQNPQFIWSAKAGIKTYKIEISTSSDFAQPILSKTITESSYTLANADLTGISQLDAIQYFWRVSVPEVKKNLLSSTGNIQVLETNVYYVDTASVTSLQVGNKAGPFKQIQTAIDVAYAARGNATTGLAIRVAKGNYTEDIILRARIGIYGGYDPANWSRNIAANATNITPHLATPVTGGADITPATTASTVIDGFTLNSGTVSGLASYLITLNNSSPTISNNTLTAGAIGGSASSYGIYMNSSSPVISGNTITAGTTIGSTSSVGIYSNASSPTISSNTINGGSTAGAGISYGIYLNNSSSVNITGNTVATGSAGNTYGMYNTGSTAVTVSNNTITGGTAIGVAGNSYGMYNANSSPTITNNTITGGISNNVGSYALYNTAASAPIITRNVIKGASVSGTGNSYGIYNDSSSPAISQNTIISGSTSASTSYAIQNINVSSPTISNNNITAGAGNFSYGIHNSVSSAANIANNTINGGSAISPTGVYANNSILIITNNIIFTEAGNAILRYGVYEANGTSNPASFQNNLITDCPTALYYNGGATAITTEANLAVPANTTGGTVASTSGNIGPTSVVNFAAILFTNIPVAFDIAQDGGDGGFAYNGSTSTLETNTTCANYIVGQFIEYNADGVARSISGCSTASLSGIVTFSPVLSIASANTKPIRIWGTNSTNLVYDYHLTNSTPAAIRNGGKDTSQSTCGSAGSSSCGNITTDRDGTTRTLPYSIGAYEKD